jgi:hypothetical protein
LTRTTTQHDSSKYERYAWRRRKSHQCSSKLKGSAAVARTATRAPAQNRQPRTDLWPDAAPEAGTAVETAVTCCCGLDDCAATNARSWSSLRSIQLSGASSTRLAPASRDDVTTGGAAAAAATANHVFVNQSSVRHWVKGASLKHMSVREREGERGGNEALKRVTPQEGANTSITGWGVHGVGMRPACGTVPAYLVWRPRLPQPLTPWLARVRRVVLVLVPLGPTRRTRTQWWGSVAGTASAGRHTLSHTPSPAWSTRTTASHPDAWIRRWIGPPQPRYVCMDQGQHRTG